MAKRTTRKRPAADGTASNGVEIPADVAELTYEQAIEQLEAIIDRIESGEVGLEQSVAEYERGMALRRHCHAILSRAEQRITELTPEDDAADTTGSG